MRLGRFFMALFFSIAGLAPSACSDPDGGAAPAGDVGVDPGTDAPPGDLGPSDVPEGPSDVPEGPSDAGPAPTCPAGCGETCPQGCFEAECGGDDIELTASLHTVGASARTSSASVHYRPLGWTTWLRGQPSVPHRGDRRGVVAFGLASDTDYEVNLGGQCGSIRTWPALADVPSDEVEVSEGASIQAAIDAGAPRIRVRPGVYREELYIARPLQLLADEGAVLDGAAPAPTDWRSEGDGLHSASIGVPELAYLRRDGERLFHYSGADALASGDVEEGWLVRDGRLWVRSLADPSSHTWQVPALRVAIQIEDTQDVRVSGFEIRDYGAGEYPKGIDVVGSQRVVIQGNHVHATPTPVWLRRGAESIRIEGNRLHQTFLDVPWRQLKGTDHENDAITVHEARGVLIRANEIHGVFNGVYAGSFGGDDPALGRDIDVHDNRFTDIMDDALEPEGAAVNARFWRNEIRGTLNGISLAPVTEGPVYVVRNTLSEYGENPFKLHNGSSAPVFLFHNTAWTDRPDQNGLSLSDPFSGVTSRNNVIRGTAYAIEQTRADTDSDFDYDNLASSRPTPKIKWSGERYDTLDDWCAATGLGCASISAGSQMIDPASGDFALRPESPNIDAGARLLGINDDYAGTAPDIGAQEWIERP